MTRREFVKAVLASLGAAAVSPSVASEAVRACCEHHGPQLALPKGFMVTSCCIECEAIEIAHSLDEVRRYKRGRWSMSLELVGPHTEIEPFDPAAFAEEHEFVVRFEDSAIVRLRGSVTAFSVTREAESLMSVLIDVQVIGEPQWLYGDLGVLPTPTFEEMGRALPAPRW